MPELTEEVKARIAELADELRRTVCHVTDGNGKTYFLKLPLTVEADIGTRLEWRHDRANGRVLFRGEDY